MRIQMRARARLVAFVLSLPLLAVGPAYADTIFYTFERAMATEDVKDILDPEVKLYFGTQPTPPLAEKSRPDSHSRSGISIAPFGRNPDVLCREGFTENLQALIGKAKRMGFDTIFNIRGKSANGTVKNGGFDCGAGRRTAEVRLVVEFGLTEEGARHAAQLDAVSGRQPAKRKAPSKNALFLPLVDVMNSPEVKTLLGSVRVHWGAANTPAFSERFGPDAYDGEADVKALGREAACRKAVVEALSTMLQDATEQGYDGIMKIRSYLDEQYAPNDADIECEADASTASVNLLGTLVKLK